MCNILCFIQLSLFPEFNTLSVMYGEPSLNFIEQECPYVLSDATAPRTAGQILIYSVHCTCTCTYMYTHVHVYTCIIMCQCACIHVLLIMLIYSTCKYLCMVKMVDLVFLHVLLVSWFIPDVYVHVHVRALQNSSFIHYSCCTQSPTSIWWYLNHSARYRPQMGIPLSHHLVSPDRR